MILSKPCTKCHGKGWEQFMSDAFPVLCFVCHGHGEVETDASAVLASALGCTLHTATKILKGTWRGKGRTYPSSYAITILGRLCSLAEHEPNFLEGFL
jgi:hypothetical protein